MGLILILMLVYYRFFGLIANIALVLNLILLCALLSIIDATLTLPGIAGIVLTVGMAVDANVLIYERIREELRHGLSPQAAIYAGYERAFSTILDANVTTFIVAVILFAVGTGPVRGFAVTLSLGLLTSMLTGITYTRAIVNWYYGNRTVKKLSIGI
jgi:preprotein translocase subunit SecD